jgi:hypothetical protein
VKRPNAANLPKRLIPEIRPVLAQLWVAYQLEGRTTGFEFKKGMSVLQVLSTGGSLAAIDWLIEERFVYCLTSQQSSRIIRRSRLRLTKSGTRLADALLDRRPARRKLKPYWDSQMRQLWVGKVLVKEFSQPSQNQCLILDGFDELGWPPAIDDPLPGDGSKKRRKRLLDAIRRLNSQINQRIRFYIDGNGTRIRWELID